MKIIFRLALVLLIIITILGFSLYFIFGPVERKDSPVLFIIPEDQIGFEMVSSLSEQKLIRNPEAFRLLFLLASNKKILSGGYRLNQKMNALEIMEKLTGEPDLVWIKIREGLRKEQIGEILQENLKWSNQQLNEWDKINTVSKTDYAEGVYFPDTYLLPKDETVEEIAQRFINHFNEVMAPLFSEFAKKDIKWTTGIKIASLIQREAGGSEDMPLISGIIWNRLDKGMKLEIDSTMQYTRGNPSTSSGSGDWWGPVDLKEKSADSPYNTYLYKGLPPTPICNPGLAAITAALNPVETDCLFYLHDSSRQIHCAKTYQEHLENIKKYL